MGYSRKTNHRKRDNMGYSWETFDEEKCTITREKKGSSYKNVIYPVYSKESDTTVIFMDTIKKKTGKRKATEVIGFYYGPPALELVILYEGNMKAFF